MRPKDGEKREAIKQQTFQIAAEHGIAGIKMATLAKKVGISPSTLYVYFADKEHLIRTLFAEVTKEMVVEMVKAFDPSLPYKLNLKQIWLKYLHFRIDNHAKILFYERVKASPFFHKIATDIKTSEMDPAMELIRIGKKQLLLKNLDEDLLMATLGGMTDRMSDLFIQGEMPLDDEHIDICFTLMWDSIRA